MNVAASRSSGRRRTWRALLVLNAGYAALLLALALAPRVPTGGLVISDAMSHAVAYGVQTVLLYRLIATTSAASLAVVGGCVGACLFGLLAEVLQMLQPARSVEIRDVAANLVGAAMVGLSLAVMLRLRSRSGAAR